MIEITKEFRFDAAHYLGHAPEGHPNRRMHGHSFNVEVTLTGAVDPRAGWIRDFGEIDDVLARLRSRLDHYLLNEVKGLETPTLENLCRYIFAALEPDLPGLVRVAVTRPSCGERAVFAK